MPLIKRWNFCTYTLSVFSIIVRILSLAERLFQICTRAETSATKDSSPCNSTLINLLSARDRLRLEREERATARLRRRQTEQEGRRSERTEVREARLNRRSVHGEESVVFSGSIPMELDCEGSIVSACTEHYKFEFLRCCITHPLISDIIFLYQLAQVRLHNVLHFLVLSPILVLTRLSAKERQNYGTPFVSKVLQ